MTPRPQSSAYPKFDSGLVSVHTSSGLGQQEGFLGPPSTQLIPQRNISDPSSSSSSGSKADMQSLRGAFLGREEKEKEKERQGVGKRRGDEKQAVRSAGVPGPLKSAMKAPSRAHSVEKIPNSDPLPEDRETLTGLLNHTTAQLQKLADRAERINEWLDMDLIVLSRLTTDAKTAAAHLPPVSPAPSRSPSTSLPHSPATVFNTNLNEAPITDKILELNSRIAAMHAWRKDLERSVYWQREEYRRIEKALGRKKSGQSGAVPQQTRNVGFEDQAKLGGAGGVGVDLVDTPENRASLQGLEDLLRAGMKLPGEEQAEGVEPGKGAGVLWRQDYARERWTSSLSRLPTQSEREDIFGPKALQRK